MAVPLIRTCSYNEMVFVVNKTDILEMTRRFCSNEASTKTYVVQIMDVLTNRPTQLLQSVHEPFRPTDVLMPDSNSGN